MDNNQQQKLDRFFQDNQNKLEDLVTTGRRKVQNLQGVIVAELVRIFREKDAQYNESFIQNIPRNSSDITQESARDAQAALHKFWQTIYAVDQVIIDLGITASSNSLETVDPDEVREYIRGKAEVVLQGFTPAPAKQREQGTVDSVREISKQVPKESKDIIKKLLKETLNNLVVTANITNDFEITKQVVDLVRSVVQLGGITENDRHDELNAIFTRNGFAPPNEEAHSNLSSLHDLSCGKNGAFINLNLPNEIPDTILKQFIKDRVTILLCDDPAIKEYIKESQKERFATMVEPSSESSLERK